MSGEASAVLEGYCGFRLAGVRLWWAAGQEAVTGESLQSQFVLFSLTSPPFEQVVARLWVGMGWKERQD